MANGIGGSTALVTILVILFMASMIATSSMYAFARDCDKKVIQTSRRVAGISAFVLSIVSIPMILIGIALMDSFDSSSSDYNPWPLIFGSMIAIVGICGIFYTLGFNIVMNIMNIIKCGWNDPKTIVSLITNGVPILIIALIYIASGDIKE